MAVPFYWIISLQPLLDVEDTHRENNEKMIALVSRLYYNTSYVGDNYESILYKGEQSSLRGENHRIYISRYKSKPIL